MSINKKCVFCKEVLKKHQFNNAEPIKKGYCCDKCNVEKVVPERVKRLVGFYNDK